MRKLSQSAFTIYSLLNAEDLILPVIMSIIYVLKRFFFSL